MSHCTTQTAKVQPDHTTETRCLIANPPPPCNPPPRRPSLHFFSWQYLLRWFVLPICHTHVLALLSHHFTVSCVYSVIFSVQKAVYRVSCCFVRPKMFSHGERIWYHSRTLGAHVLATVVGPSPNGPQFALRSPPPPLGRPSLGDRPHHLHGRPSRATGGGLQGGGDVARAGPDVLARTGPQFCMPPKSIRGPTT